MEHLIPSPHREIAAAQWMISSRADTKRKEAGEMARLNCLMVRGGLKTVDNEILSEVHLHGT